MLETDVPDAARLALSGSVAQIIDFLKYAING